MEDGEYTIEAGGGSENSTIQRCGLIRTRSMGNYRSRAGDTTSMKALKRQSNVTINNGTYTIDVADDGYSF